MTYKETRNYLNQQIKIYQGVGFYDIPKIKPLEIDIDGCEWISFNQAKTAKDCENKVCHFYVDDYQFDRLWANPDRYIDLLSRFKAVVIS